MAERLKVLVSAYACEPGRGSEPGVGWNGVRQIARFHEVWVITSANHRAPIERALAQAPLPNVHWVYCDLPRWARFWKNGPQNAHLYYYLWQIWVYFVGKRLHQEVNFDLVHHVTIVNYWMPSFLVLLPAPFIWGPVAGGEAAPKNFYRTFSLRGKIYEYSRTLAIWIGEHDPFVGRAIKRARLALATTPETEKQMKRIGYQRVGILTQVGLTKDEVNEIYGFNSTPLGDANVFRLISIGRLLHWKGFHLGLMAFAEFQKKYQAAEYHLIGDGPERRNLERLARELKIVSKVQFHGQLSRLQVFTELAKCNVLVHPSLHDSGAGVCVEAMAMGRPVICLDLGGPALQVTEATGFKVPANTPEQVVNDLAAVMLRLAQNPELCRRMGEAARRRVAEVFDWERKGEHIREIYQEVMARNV